MKTNQIIALVVAILVVGAGVFFVVNRGSIVDDRDRKIPDSEYYPVSIKTYHQGTDKYHEQTFYESPKRIVVMQDTNLELLCYFGLEDRVVGTSAKVDAVTLFPEHQESYNAVEKRSGLSTEVIISLEPDLIVAWTSYFNENRGLLIPAWNDYGVNCIVTNRPAVTVDDYLDMLYSIGVVFNMVKEAEEKIADFTSAYADVERKTASMSEEDKPTVLVIEPGYETGGYGYGASFLTGDLITKAGGRNLFPGGMEMLSFEQIRAYDPDVVIIVPDYTQFITTAEYSVNEFITTPGFASMTDRVHGFEFYEIYMGGLLPDDIIDRIFKVLYPD